MYLARSILQACSRAGSSLPSALQEAVFLLKLVILIVRSSKINLFLYSLNTAVRQISRFSIRCLLWRVWIPNACYLKMSALSFCWEYVHK